MRNPPVGALSAEHISLQESVRYGTVFDPPEQMVPACETEYTYTEKDVLKFNFYTAYWGSKAYLTLMGIAALTLLVDAALVQPQNLHFLITPAVMVGAANVYFPLYLLKTTRQESKTPVRIVFTIREDGFHLRTSCGDLKVKWSDFYKIVSTPHYFYLFWNHKSAEILPKRVLSPMEKSWLLYMKKQRFQKSRLDKNGKCG